MGLLERLRAVGGRLGILVISESHDSVQDGPVKLETRTVAVTELIAEVEEERVKELADAPAEMTAKFEDVCAAAGVRPGPHGWTVDRLHRLLKSPVYADLDRRTAQNALLGQLRAEGCPVEDLVRDAVQRDRALDAYAERVAARVEERAGERERDAAKLETQIEALREAQRDLERETAEDRRRLLEWRHRKADYEKGMAWTLSHLLSDRVITVDEPSGDRAE